MVFANIGVLIIFHNFVFLVNRCTHDCYMVLTLDGSSEHVAHLLRKCFFAKGIKFDSAVNVRKWIKQIKLPNKLNTCASYYELPFNISTIVCELCSNQFFLCVQGSNTWITHVQEVVFNFILRVAISNDRKVLVDQ